MIFGHQNPARIGMTFDLDAEHIEKFTLAPIRHRIHTGRSRDLGAVSVYWDSDLQLKDFLRAK